MNAKVEEWIMAFKKVATDRLDQRNSLTASESLEIDIKECTRDENCLTVTLGEIMQHVIWSESDPAQAAEYLLQKMLPPPINPAEANGSDIAEANGSDILVSKTETDRRHSLVADDPTLVRDMDEKVVSQGGPVQYVS
jgi:hypothetical protein